MKKILFILSFLLPFGGYAQELQGFWGLKFAMAPETVEQIVKDRNGKKPEEGSNNTIMAFKNCDFSGNKAYLVQLKFYNNKLYGGDITIIPSREDLVNVYNDIVDEITRKYQRDVAKQGSVMAQFETGKATWEFERSTSKIIATIENNAIRIRYTDGLIGGQQTAALERYNKSDY